MNTDLLRCLSESNDRFSFANYNYNAFKSFVNQTYIDSDFQNTVDEDQTFVIMFNSVHDVAAIAEIKEDAEWNSREITNIVEYISGSGTRLFKELTKHNDRYIFVYLASCKPEFVSGKRFHEFESDSGKTYFYKNQALSQDDLNQFLEEKCD